MGVTVTNPDRVYEPASRLRVSTNRVTGSDRITLEIRLQDTRYAVTP